MSNASERRAARLAEKDAEQARMDHEALEAALAEPPESAHRRAARQIIEDRDHCGYVEAEGDGAFLARIGTDAMKWSKAFCDMLFGGELNLLTGNRDSVEGTMIGWFANAIEAGRTAGIAFAAPELDELEEPPAVALARLQHELMIAAQQRDFLSRQVDSLVQRLAASHVAAGLIDMAAAQGFVQKEILPINQVLAQIAASAPDGA